MNPRENNKISRAYILWKPFKETSERKKPFKIAVKDVYPGNFGKFLGNGYVIGICDKKSDLQNKLYLGHF